MRHWNVKPHVSIRNRGSLLPTREDTGGVRRHPYRGGSVHTHHQCSRVNKTRWMGGVVTGPQQHTTRQTSIQVRQRSATFCQATPTLQTRQPPSMDPANIYGCRHESFLTNIHFSIKSVYRNFLVEQRP